jgi:hypothetical protein
MRPIVTVDWAEHGEAHSAGWCPHSLIGPESGISTEIVLGFAMLSANLLDSAAQRRGVYRSFIGDSKVTNGGCR